MKAHLILLLIILAASCSPLPPPTIDPDTAATEAPGQGDAMSANETDRNPFAPQAGDKDLVRGNAYLTEASVVIRESLPPQISLSISGNLPTPCNQLRVAIGAPDEKNGINVELYSVSDPNKACAQVLKPFEESIDLGTFKGGHYSVRVNGETVGEFDS